MYSIYFFRMLRTFLNTNVQISPVSHFLGRNKRYWADSLLNKVLVKYKEWYGDDFQLFNHLTQGKVYYKMDGKRTILLFVQDQ